MNTGNKPPHPPMNEEEVKLVIDVPLSPGTPYPQFPTPTVPSQVVTKPTVGPYHLDFKVGEFIKEVVDEYKVYKKVNTTKILVKVVEFVDKFKHVSDRSAHALSIYNQILHQLELDVDDDDLIEETIEIMVSLTKGEYDINKISKCAASCFPKICMGFKNSKSKKKA